MTKFVILAIQRSGTNFLRGCLNSHPEIKCLDEVFLHDAEFPESYRKSLNEDPRLGIHIPKYLKNLLASNNQYKAVGIDVKYNCLNHQILKAIHDLDFSIIHMIRKDSLRTIISQHLGMNRVPPIRLPLELLIREKKYIDDMVKIYSDMVKNFRSITVFYEDLTDGGENSKTLPDKEKKRILDFLGVDSNVNLFIKNKENCYTKRINPIKLEDLLINHREVKEHFSL